MTPEEPPTGSGQVSRNGWQWSVSRPFDQDAYIITVVDPLDGVTVTHVLDGVAVVRIPLDRLWAVMALVIEHTTLTLAAALEQ